MGLWLVKYLSSAQRSKFSCPYGCESHMGRVGLHYGDFVQTKFQESRQSSWSIEVGAILLSTTKQSVIHVNKASVKAFKPRNI